MNEVGICENCGKTFKYTLIHNGFNESSYAYCDKCGKVAFLNTYSVPNRLKLLFEKARHHAVSKELEKYIEKCDCGGDFRADALPRCPHCKEILSPIEANKYIKSDHPDKENGWHWQNNWAGTYAIVIEDNKIQDDWKVFSPILSLKERIRFFFWKVSKRHNVHSKNTIG